MPRDAACVLRVRGLVTGYGKKQVIGGIDLDVAQGEIVALIGHNGAGKSTVLKAVFGLLPVWHGEVLLDNRPMSIMRSQETLQSGVAYVLQGSRVFSNLTVRENLELGSWSSHIGPLWRDSVQRIFMLFPTLRARLQHLAGTLSGGEKQMLALATALVKSPRLLLLDEPSLGLAPALVKEALERIRLISRDSGVSVLIIEQKVREVLKIAHRVYVLRNGEVSHSGPTESLKDEAMLRRVYL